MDTSATTASPRRHLAALDGLRGAAAVMVVVYHCCDATGATSFGGGTLRLLISAGMLGVDFFFVLSGFLLFLPVVRDGTLGDLHRYALRRVARIVPAYYASLLVLVLLHPLFRQDGSPLATRAGVATFTAHLSFLQLEAGPLIAHVFPSTRTGFELNGVWWTLSLEALFYALLPLVAVRYRRHPFVGLALGVAAMIGWRAALFHQQALVGLLGGVPEAWSRERSERWLLHLTPQLPGYIGDFALGMTAAAVFVRLEARATRARRACAAALVLLVPLLLLAMRHTGAIWLLHTPRTSLGFYAPALGPTVLFAALVVLLPLAPPALQWPLANPLARWVGGVSYGVYLSHELVIAALATHAGLRSDVGTQTSLRLLAIVLSSALAIGALSRRLLEAPAVAAARGSSGTRGWAVLVGTTAIALGVAGWRITSFAFPAHWPSEPGGPPRHLILVSIDTLRADHLGTYGYPRDTSPRLDRFAADSVVFEQAVAQGPDTPTSQLSMLSSRYASAHGFDWRAHHIPAGLTLLADVLQADGFATWGFVDGGFLKRDFGFAQGFAHYEDEQVHVAAIIPHVLDWLDTHRAERFFLFVHCYDVHSPYRKPRPFDTLFAPAPYQGTFEPDDASLIAAVQRTRPLDPADVDHAMALYDGAIRYTDVHLGQLFDGLAARGLLDASVVMVTADHGEEFQEHGSMLHWQHFFTPNFHVPFFVRAPGRAPHRVPGPVELIDVVPTALALLGLPPQAGAMGRSLVPLIDGTQAASDAVAFAEPVQLDVPWRIAVTDERQLIVDTRTGVGRLFDVWKDPRTLVDLAPAEPVETAHLIAVARERQARATAIAPPPPEPSRIPRKELEAMGYVGPRGP